MSMLDKYIADNTVRRSQPLFNRLQGLATSDARVLVEKGRTYGDSWKQRGGVGAFMMLARKWDRIENQLKKHPRQYDVLDALVVEVFQDKVTKDGLLDDIQDLRRYLLLVEDELLCIGHEHPPESWQGMLGLHTGDGSPLHGQGGAQPPPPPPPTPAPFSPAPAPRQPPRSPDRGPRGFDPAQDAS